MKIRNFAYILIPILWGLLLLQWVVPLDRYPMDSYNYLVLAESLARGEGYTIQSVPHSMFLIGYPLHLAVCALLGLDLTIMAKVLAVGFGMGVLVITYFLGKNLLGRGEGWLALLLLAAWPMFGRWCMAPMSEPVFAFYSAAALLLAWRGAGRRSTIAVLGAFVLGGFTAITRYQGVLLWLPLCGVVLAQWRDHRSGDSVEADSSRRWQWNRLFKLLLISTVLFALPLGVWLVRNRVVLGAAGNIEYFNSFPEYLGDRYANQSGWDYALGQVMFGLVRFPLADITPSKEPWGFAAFRIAMLTLYWVAVVGATIRAVARRRWDILALALWVFEMHGFHLFWPFREERFYMPGFPIVCLLCVYAAGVFYAPGRSGSSDVDNRSEGGGDAEGEDHQGRGNPVEARRRRTFLVLGVLATVGLANSSIIYRMQLIGLRVQSTSALAKAAGEEIRSRAGRNDRVATSLHPVETYYYARHPTEFFRSADDLRRIMKEQEKRWETHPGTDLWLALPDRGLPLEVVSAVKKLEREGWVAESYPIETDRPVSVRLFRLEQRKPSTARAPAP